MVIQNCSRSTAAKLIGTVCTWLYHHSRRQEVQISFRHHGWMGEIQAEMMWSNAVRKLVRDTWQSTKRYSLGSSDDGAALQRPESTTTPRPHLASPQPSSSVWDSLSSVRPVQAGAISGVSCLPPRRSMTITTVVTRRSKWWSSSGKCTERCITGVPKKEFELWRVHYHPQSECAWSIQSKM